MRIKEKFSIILVSAAILPLLIAMIFMLLHSRQQTTELTMTNIQSRMEIAANVLDGFFNSRLSEIAAYAESPLLKTMNFSQIRPFLISELERHNQTYEKFILGKV